MNKLLISLLLAGAQLSCDQSTESPEPTTASASINDLTLVEGSSLILDVSLSEPLPEVAILAYETEDGTATAGEDYESSSGQVIFDVGVTRQTLNLKLLQDEEPEEDENFQVILSALTNNITFSKDIATITITDDDEAEAELVIPETGYTSPESYEGWTLVWQDEFSGDALNESNWTYEIGDGCPGLCGWGNNELQYYQRENTSMVDGNLVITAKKESAGSRNYTSSRLITKDKQSFQYGRVDIRAVMPYGQGIWPALWMLGSNIDEVSWPKCGEIDIMELIGGDADGRDNTIHGTIHWYDANGYANYGGSHQLSSGTFNDEYHVFSIIWDENEIRWLIDGQQYHVVDTTPATLSEFRNDYFFIFNIAVGGNWPGNPNASTVFPQYMVVDYIRIFQKN